MSGFSDEVFSAEQLAVEASQRLVELRAAWDRCGREFLAEGSMGQVIEHPLVKMIRETEIVVLRLSEAARKRHRGPETVAVVQARMGRAPSSSKLKAVKSA